MAAEDRIAELKRLMVQPDKIRNICTSAHIHHGKCITGDARVLLVDGRVPTAKKLYEQAKALGVKYEENDGYTIYDLSRQDIKVFSLNQQTGRIEKRNLSQAWKLKGGKVIKIKLRNGFEVASTPEHKYIVYEHNQLLEKEAHNLRKGDHVICASFDYFWNKSGMNKDQYTNFPVEETVGNQQMIHYVKNLYSDLTLVPLEEITESYAETVYDFTVPETHTFVAEGLVMHNTALTDNLLAASGFMSTKAAGSLDEGMATWQHADEQERLLTVDSANVSMVHTFGNERYLINLIDTPGHIDFGGNVTRAMRAVDGTIVLVCAVEGIMPQTETVMKQALRERVKPVLFINKVDRLINELKLTPEKMQERFLGIISEFNQLVGQIAEDEFKQKWQVDINDGSVAFGSARENWALSVPYMKKKNVTFKDIINLYSGTMTEEQRQDWTWKNAALHEVLLDMVIKHLPDPKEAQVYRIPKIWHGDLTSPFGKDLVSCNKDGKVGFVITRVMIDPKFNREMAAGRLFSGTIREGMTIYLNNAKQTQRVSQIFMYQGVKPEMIDNVPAGNVLALGGISGNAGETVTEGPEELFEELKHIFEPIITKSIEPARPQDLPKLVEILKKVAKEDPSLKVTINQETGESLIHGMGELHLEIIENRIKTERGFDIRTSQPIVVYRETIQKKSEEFEGKSPNKHNKFYFIIEPIEEELYNLIRSGELPTGRLKKVDASFYPLFEKTGYVAKEAKKIKEFFNGNVFIDGTRGIVQISEVMELVLDGFEQVMREGPLAREPCVKLKVTLVDTKLHEDAIHRGPAQVLPAVRQGIKGAMLTANASMFEPLQVIQIDAPTSYLGEISKLVQNKRGQLLDTDQQGEYMSIKAKLPVAESFGLANDLRSATSGRGNYFMVDQLFERLPSELQPKVIRQIRERKGLKVDEDMAES